MSNQKVTTEQIKLALTTVKQAIREGRVHSRSAFNGKRGDDTLVSDLWFVDGGDCVYEYQVPTLNMSHKKHHLGGDPPSVSTKTVVVDGEPWEVVNV